MPRTFTLWFFTVFTLLGWMTFFVQHEELRRVKMERDDAERRMGECIDIAADAREEALLSETAWINAAEEASYCMMSEDWMYDICPGPEYWTSHDRWVGP